MVTQATSTRDANGRFLPGCAPGPGRPKRDREAAWQEAFGNALPPDELAAVIAAMLTRAKSGSVSAARLLLEHAVGRPAIKITFDDRGEYAPRVAGLTPDQALTRQLELIQRRITEVRSREELIRNGQQGPVPPMPVEATANGHATTIDDDECDPTEKIIRGCIGHGMAPEAIAAIHGVSEKYIARIQAGMRQENCNGV